MNCSRSGVRQALVLGVGQQRLRRTNLIDAGGRLLVNGCNVGRPSRRELSAFQVPHGCSGTGIVQGLPLTVKDRRLVGAAADILQAVGCEAPRWRRARY